MSIIVTKKRIDFYASNVHILLKRTIKDVIMVLS